MFRHLPSDGRPAAPRALRALPAGTGLALAFAFMLTLAFAIAYGGIGIPLRVGLASLRADQAQGVGTPLAEQIRSLLKRGHAVHAVRILEQTLPSAKGPERAVVKDLLADAYESAALLAEQAGRTEEAQTYRENRSILQRPRNAKRNASPAAPAQTQAQAKTPEPAPEPVEPPRTLQPETLTPRPDPLPLPPASPAPAPAPAATSPDANAKTDLEPLPGSVMAPGAAAAPPTTNAPAVKPPDALPSRPAESVSTPADADSKSRIGLAGTCGARD